MRFLLSIILLLNVNSISASDNIYQNDDLDSTVFFNDEYSDTEENEKVSEEEDEEDGDWPTPPPLVPINDYLPLLAVAAVGLGFYYRKELNQITK